MNSKTKKTILLSVFLLSTFYFLLPAFPAQAVNATLPKIDVPDLQVDLPTLAPFSQPSKCETGKLCFPWIAEYLIAIYKYAAGSAGIVAVIVMMWGGIVWLTAGGSQQRVTEAQDWIKGSVTGLVLLFSSYLILFVVNPSLVNLQLIKVNYIAPNAVDKILDWVVELGSGSGITGGATASGIPKDPEQRKKYDIFLQGAARDYVLDCTLLEAILYVESHGNPNATSEKNAQGLMQMLPSTAAGLGCNVDRLYDPQTNIDCAAKFIKEDLMKTACDGKKIIPGICNSSETEFILAAYNGGQPANAEAVRQCPGRNIPQWKCETTGWYKKVPGYINTVLSNYKTLKESNTGC